MGRDSTTTQASAARAEAGRFSLYFRGEYQHSPGYTGYPLSTAQLLANYDQIPLAQYPVQSTIPYGQISAAGPLHRS